MIKSFKTEINPTEEQKARINRIIGTCRYVYNFYLAHNRELYEKGEKFMTGKSFSVWLNNEYIPNHPDKQWIKDAYKQAFVSMYRRLFPGIYDYGVYIAVPALELVSRYDFDQSKAYTMK